LCASINDEVVHGIPGPRKLVEGDILSLDFGAIYDGYYADAALTVPIGKISPEAERLLRVTEEALTRGINASRVGNRLSAIGRAVESYVVAEGYSVVREFVGHGVGQKMHEPPQVPNFVAGFKNFDPLIRQDMTFAVEPMVNMGKHHVRIKPDGWTVVTRDGSLSAHFEHTILVTSGDPEIITVQG
jgi:methionyl aminopeptidase